MKPLNVIYVIFAVVSALLLSQAASAASNSLVTESAPVYPGATTYVYVPIQNMGSGTFMEDVSVRLVTKDTITNWELDYFHAFIFKYMFVELRNCSFHFIFCVKD